jgi:outer membrane protein W
MSIGKKVLFGVAFVLCASLAFAESVRVKSANVNVRSGPTATATVVGKLPQGKMLEVIEVSGQWTRITDGAITGWVSSALVERVADTPAAAPAATSGSSGASRSSAAPARSSAPPARRSSHKASSDEQIVNFGVNVDYENNDANLGFGGRVWVTPASTLPELRIMGAVDIFPFGSNDLPTMIQVTANGAYTFRDVSPEVKPYVGAGLVYTHVSGGSTTKFDIMGGATFKQRFFADLRVVLADGTPIIISAGVRF